MKLDTRARKKFRVTNKLKRVANSERFRLSVFRSSKNISAQIIDDKKNITLLSASTVEKDIKETKTKNKSDFEGFILIHNKLNEVLKQKGLLEIEDLIGSKFNSEVHEAISQIPCDNKDKGKIIEVIEKGYSLGDKIIRFPKVIVGN